MQQLIFRYLFVSLSIAASATYAFASSTNETQRTAKVTCSSSTAHTFDFLIGEWMGTEEHETPSHGGPPAGPTQFKIEGAVNGCVLHEIWRFYPTSKAAAAELWRTYDEDTHKWTLYFVNDALHPQVWLGSLEDGIWQFYRRWELNGKQMISRQSWSASPGGFTRRLER